MSTPCPQPSGYVPELCTNHKAFVPPVHPLAYTGVDPWPFIAVGIVLLLIGFAFVAYRALHKRSHA